MNKFIVFLLIFLTGCSPFSTEKRKTLIEELNLNKFNKNIYMAKHFDVFSLEKIKDNNKLTIYIEGDGLAWIDRFTISSDPTPTDPIGFKLALLDKGNNVIYLARPCQYEWSNNCNKDVWTTSQYSSVVLSSYREIINHLSLTYKAIHLVGYSGGAGIAMYLGSVKNNNIKSITTIAGNINHNELTQILNISRLKKSINFYSIEKKIKQIPQIHYYGLEDKTVPNLLQTSYKNRNADNSCVKIQAVSGVDHNKGWLKFWTDNSNNIPVC